MTTLISWEKPRKVRSTDEHNRMNQADCDVPGTYVPNMSHEDMKKWKGKIVGTRIGHPQIEIRKYPFVIILSNGGYKYKNYTRDRTQDIVFHMSSAGPIQFTQEELGEFFQVIEEAKDKLQELTEEE